mmetsp:Transcript_37059/g.103099  ORF Transcript_37059/g.103099 Transcript_37059/m.103099 type:complete len:247 (-) Transcript_37059:304-1044(-)
MRMLRRVGACRAPATSSEVDLKRIQRTQSACWTPATLPLVALTRTSGTTRPTVGLSLISRRACPRRMTLQRRRSSAGHWWWPSTRRTSHGSGAYPGTSTSWCTSPPIRGRRTSSRTWATRRASTWPTSWTATRRSPSPWSSRRRGARTGTTHCPRMPSSGAGTGAGRPGAAAWPPCRRTRRASSRTRQSSHCWRSSHCPVLRTAWHSKSTFRSKWRRSKTYGEVSSRPSWAHSHSVGSLIVARSLK